MTRKVAILGLGGRGVFWARTFEKSGWNVAGFDPDPSAKVSTLQRQSTISATVNRADWVFCCLPERLELLQKVIQRAQSEAPEHSVIAVVSKSFSVEDAQSCAIDSARVVLVSERDGGGFNADISVKTAGDVRQLATEVLSELAAINSLEDFSEVHSKVGTKSA